MRANKQDFPRFAYTGGKRNHLTECSHLVEGNRLRDVGRDDTGIEAE